MAVDDRHAHAARLRCEGALKDAIGRRRIDALQPRSL